MISQQGEYGIVITSCRTAENPKIDALLISYNSLWKVVCDFELPLWKQVPYPWFIHIRTLPTSALLPTSDALLFRDCIWWSINARVHAINKCLQQAFPLNSDQPNGGCNLILFDIIQEKKYRWHSHMVSVSSVIRPKHSLWLQAGDSKTIPSET